MDRKQRRLFRRFLRRHPPQEPDKGLFKRRLLEVVPATLGVVVALAGLLYVKEMPPVVKIKEKPSACAPLKSAPECKSVLHTRIKDPKAKKEADEECRVYSSAIQPDHPAIRDLVKKAVKVHGSLNIDQILDVYDHLSRTLTYEKVFHRLNPYKATKVLKDGRGDCKNLTVVLASALLSIGAEVNIIIDDGKTPDKGHVFLQVKIPKEDRDLFRFTILLNNRLPYPLPLVKGMDKQLKALAQAEQKVKVRLNAVERLSKKFKRYLPLQNKMREKVKNGQMSIQEFKEKSKEFGAILKRAKFLLNAVDADRKNPVVRALRESLEEKWLWFNGRPVEFDDINTWTDSKGDIWLTLDLATESYPGSVGEYSADRTLELSRPK